MSTHTSSDAPETETEPPPRPGHDLAVARERAGIGRDDMAVRLRLRHAQLDSLEQDDYAALPPPTFVRGYLRAYARELDLEPEAFVAAYAVRTANDGRAELLTRAGMEHSHVGGPGVWVGLLLIVLVVGGGAGAWWYQHRMIDRDGTAVEDASGADSDTLTDANAEADGEGIGGDEPARDDQAGGGDSTAMDDSAQEGTVATSDSASPSADQPVSTTRAGSTDSGNTEGGSGEGETESASAATEEGVQSAAQGGALGESVGESLEAASGSATQTAENETAAMPTGTETADGTGSQGADSTAAAGGPARLVLAFDGRSWVEVRDATGSKLAYTLYHDTAPLKVQGEPPFRIYLGDARAVEISLNGESVDMQPFIQGNNTARVVVDQSGARAR